MYCTACGTQMVEGSAFCPSCGRPTASPGVPTVEQGPPPVASPPNAFVAAPAGGNYAGFWLRVIAAFIDGFLLFIVVFAFFGIRRRMFGMSGPFIGPGMYGPIMRPLGLLRLGAIAAAWLYFALMESSAWQATIGKRALGLYVTDLQGRRIHFCRATGRYFAKIISNLTLLIGYAMAGFTAKKQALHDMIAGCLVMKKA